MLSDELEETRLKKKQKVEVSGDQSNKDDDDEDDDEKKATIAELIFKRTGSDFKDENLKFDEKKFATNIQPFKAKTDVWGFNILHHIWDHYNLNPDGLRCIDVQNAFIVACTKYIIEHGLVSPYKGDVFGRSTVKLAKMRKTYTKLKEICPDHIK